MEPMAENILSPGWRRAWHLTAAVLGLITPATGRVAASCVLPPAAEIQMRWLAENPDPYTSHLLGGDVYLKAGCLDDAEAAYRKARETLVEMPAGEKRETMDLGVLGSLELVAAHRTLRRGDVPGARRALASILDRYVHTRLLLTTTFTLADLGRVVRLDARESELLETSLRKLAENGFWQADAYLADRRLLAGEGEGLLAELEERLQEELPVLRRIALQTTYADVLFKLGRLLEAQLLLAEIEDEVAEKVVEPEFRVQYLKLCHDVWQMRARRGGDPHAQERAAAFTTALLQLQAIATGDIR